LYYTEEKCHRKEVQKESVPEIARRLSLLSPPHEFTILSFKLNVCIKEPRIREEPFGVFKFSSTFHLNGI